MKAKVADFTAFFWASAMDVFATLDDALRTFAARNPDKSYNTDHFGRVWEVGRRKTTRLPRKRSQVGQQRSEYLALCIDDNCSWLSACPMAVLLCACLV